jgi:ABC-type phosphate transport system permease subunit
LSGLNGKLEAAVRAGEEVELFMAERCILGAKFANGKVFASNWGGIGIAPTIAGCFVCIALVFTIIGAPLGVFGGMFIANAGRCGRLTRKARTVSNAVLI